MSNERLTRDQQREAARAKAKAMREAQKKNEGRKRFLMITSIVAGSAALITAIVFGALSTIQKSEELGDGPATAIFNGGVRIGEGLKVITSADDVDPAVPNIIIYQDMQCPACQAFEVPNMPQIRELVNAGKYTLELHPISFLDGASANEYSSRSASAVLCVAEKSPDNFFSYNEALMVNQPAEGTAGLSNEQLSQLATQIGVTEQPALDCISKNTWATWAKAKSNEISSLGKVPGTEVEFRGTPTVVVNGVRYDGEISNPAMFLQWLQQNAPVAGE
jgi:protein-disulfide isomerase